MSSFNEGAQFKQLLTLLPQVTENEESNLMIGKGISSYVKIAKQYFNES